MIRESAEQLNVGELIDLLNEFHPAEKIAFVNEANAYLVMTGINRELTQLNGTVTLQLRWAEGNKPEESTLDLLNRRRKEIEDAILEEKAKIGEQGAFVEVKEKRVYKKKKKSTRMAGKLSPEEAHAKGLIYRRGGVGRPRKMTPEERARYGLPPLEDKK